ncbi:hypothetical protein CVT26_005739 [Gymnopilus dilepis]|uniref:Uncharacterized protein n=1 Tax=Gymnopilus dilepis TaxID=231916 RepID=A0A409VPF5_9AGAR|nr:hypothetical protein CVT26_005739 [Gymnopilus dilepis]
MNLMASVSRSSGLERDGDDLKNYKTQEEYRAFIQEKVDELSRNYPRTSSESEDRTKQRMDAQENVLILFRKLREGVASSSRRDAFALEVYETSLYLSAIFGSPKQTISIIHHLFPPATSGPSTPFTFSNTATTDMLLQPSTYTVLIALLHHLVVSYPSQSTYFQQIDSIPETVLPRTSELAKWLKLLTKALRARNYAKFSVLSQRSSLPLILKDPSAPTSELRTSDIEPTLGKLSLANKSDPAKGLEGVLSLLKALRGKVSETAWTIIRSAYRELSCDQASGGTRTWLARSLCLEPIFLSGKSRELRGREEGEADRVDVETWLEARVTAGHVRRKEGVEGRWIVCKVR